MRGGLCEAARRAECGNGCRRPDKLVLCADEMTLQDERPKVLAVVRA